MKTNLKNLRVLLIDPPVALRRTIIESPNMGLAYIGASLIDEGVRVRILDLNAIRYSKRVVKNYLKKNKYDIYGIGCMIVAYDYVKFLSKTIKKYYSDSLIVAGNSIASSIPEVLLKTTNVDIAVIGEGEITIKEIVQKFIQDKDYSQIAGIYFKKNNKIIKTEDRPPVKDLDLLSMPAINLYSMELYLASNKNQLYPDLSFYPLSSTRGCPFNCTYCYHAYQGYKVRRHSTERIIREIKRALKNYENIMFSFVDDNFTFKKKSVLEFCDALEKENLDIKWAAASRVDVIDEELVKRMKEMGCVSVGFGIESGSQTILDNIKKNVRVEQAKNAIQICHKHGMKTLTSYMLGNRGENYHTAMETYKFIKEVKIEHAFRFFLPIPFPKTEIYEYAKKNGMIKNNLKLIRSFRKEDSELIRINFSELSDKNLIKLKRSLEKLLNEEKNGLRKNYHINKFLENFFGSFYSKIYLRNVIVKMMSFLKNKII